MQAHTWHKKQQASGIRKRVSQEDKLLDVNVQRPGGRLEQANEQEHFKLRLVNSDSAPYAFSLGFSLPVAAALLLDALAVV